ncbi:Os11g0696501 [Oryza sativa Japonica Group]|uniref:Os11g0696501 protein n=1 Tax=Oryza sativa subsp. japonica TaxID=39947 RepID=A0A0P0Y5J8_ORYSJ|nr:hypothetical protein EE612_057130 [Oryza sativa]BAT15351.1 Os11g0696501 [Oryza sativa Japonica Group]
MRATDIDEANLVGVERQQLVVVLEEDDALACAVKGEGLVLVGADVLPAEGGVLGDVVEVAEPHERHVLVGEGVVNVGLPHLALVDGLHAVGGEEVHERVAVGVVLPALAAVEVEASLERGGAGLGAGVAEPGGVVGHDADGVAVGDDVAVEAPVAADGLRQEARVGARRDAVDAVVRAHDAAHVAVADAHLEWPLERLHHVALIDARVELEPRVVVPVVEVVGGVVLAARRRLERPRVRVAAGGDRLVPGDVLHAADEVDGVAADDVRVLAGRLQSSPPPRVAHHVDVGAPVRQPSLPHVVHRPRLQGLVEGGGAVDDVGEDGGVVDGGDAGVEVRRGEVVELGGGAGAGEAMQRLRPPPVRRQADAGSAVGPVAEGADLLLHGHPADEVADTVGVRQRRVAVAELRHVQAQAGEPRRVAHLGVHLGGDAADGSVGRRGARGGRGGQ